MSLTISSSLFPQKPKKTKTQDIYTKLQRKLNKQQVETNCCVNFYKNRYGDNLINVIHKTSGFIIFAMKVVASLQRNQQI
jgi:hypothetical protein